MAYLGRRMAIADGFFMNEPRPLYVDEISPDQVKAVVSDVNTVYANLVAIMSVMGKAKTKEDIGERISGVVVLPVGRYVCLLSRSAGDGKGRGMLGSRGTLGMVLLDLVDRVDIAYKIAEQFDNKDLEDRFIDVLTDIVWHPERHETFRIVVGRPPRKRGELF